MSETKQSGGQFIMLGEAKIRYFEQGEGETVLFIHGLGQAMYTFRRNVLELAKHCHVVSIDLIGHGLSSCTECDYTIADFSKLIAEFMDAMNIEKATLVGFSTGAMIALDVAENYPDLVKRLVLLSPGGVTKTYPAQIKRLKKQLFADMYFTFFNKSMIKKVLMQAYYNPTFVKKDVIEHYFKVLSNSDTRDAFISSVATWDDYSVYENLSLVTAPAYIFWGEEDTFHPIAMLETFEEELSDVFVATFACCGHLLHEERANEFNQKLISIISSND